MSVPGEFRLLTSEMLFDGSIYTFDVEANASYVNVWPQPDACALGKSVDIGDGITLDFASDGRLFGIERIGGPIEPWVVMRALRWTLSETGPGVYP